MSTSNESTPPADDATPMTAQSRVRTAATSAGSVIRSAYAVIRSRLRRLHVAVWREEVPVSSTAGEPRLLTRNWLRACDAFLSATLAHARYLQTSGRLKDPASMDDIRTL